jgi:hypothetical protein
MSYKINILQGPFMTTKALAIEKIYNELQYNLSIGQFVKEFNLDYDNFMLKITELHGSTHNNSGYRLDCFIFCHDNDVENIKQWLESILIMRKLL